MLLRILAIGNNMNIFYKIIQHNWFAVIYFNFRMLPFRQAFKLPFDFYHSIRFVNLSGKVKIDSEKIYRGMIKIGSQGSDMFPHNTTILNIQGTWEFEGSAVLGCGNYISIGDKGRLEIGDNSIIGANNLIICERRIILGNNFLSSWNCQIMDTDTHPIIDCNTNTKSIYVQPINIGSHIWIGNHVCINKGSIIPNNSVVASHSLCNKDYILEGEGCIFAGVPAKVVSRNKTWKI